jgi:uncharacterized protein YdiU (UPF0061 family)
VAASHLRVGTFQYFAARGDTEAVERLVAYAIARHYPELADAAEPALALLDAVATRQASLVARWMLVGFIHGVMNTDNMTISGETIDFGPCAFMEAHDPATVFSAIDEMGRYAYRNQPAIAQWNLARLAETLLPLIDAEPQRAIDRATPIVVDFAARYAAAWTEGMRVKLGLVAPRPDDAALAESFLDALRLGAADHTCAFRALADAAADPAAEGALRALVAPPGAAALEAFLAAWRARLATETVPAATRAAAMRAVNPRIIPRNHRVEQALAAAQDAGDLAPFEALLAALARPFDDDPRHDAYALPAAPAERVCRTFCGT